RGPRREGGAEPAPLPVGAGAAPGTEEGGRADRTGAAARRTAEGAAAPPGGHREPGRGDRPRRGGRARGRRTVPEARGAGAMSLALVEHAGGRPAPLSLEALSLAARLQPGLGEPIEAALIGD